MKRLALALVLSLVTTFGVLAQKETTTPTPNDEDGLPLLHRTELSEDYDTNWERVVAELQILELIPEDGELLFLEDMALEPLGGGGSADATYRNYIMGALISVREDGGDSAGRAAQPGGAARADPGRRGDTGAPRRQRADRRRTAARPGLRLCPHRADDHIRRLPRRCGAAG